MILVDTSVWVDHLRRREPQLAGLLERGSVVMHPFVIGEMACGNLADRAAIIEVLQNLPTAVLAENHEALGFIERHALHGKGIGYIDVHLLASVALTHGSQLWTRDRRLRSVADMLACAYRGESRH